MFALLSTRKALLIYQQDQDGSWSLRNSAFEGVKVSQTHYDAKRKHLWVAVNHGHWGLKIHLSKDGGQNFEELPSPKFPEDTNLKLSDVWAMHVDANGRVHLGTEPAHLFYSDDCGQTWQFNQNFANLPYRDKWMGGGTDDTCLHSFIEDPKDPKHLIVGISCAGVLDSFDGGESWEYRNKGMLAEFLPNVEAEVGQDPHIVVQCPTKKDWLWQQNHCGLFKSEDYGQTWINYSKKDGLVSSFGWAIAVDPACEKTILTVPAHSDMVRVPVNHKLVVQRSTDGGENWQVFDQGLPDSNCYSIVYRHGLKMLGNAYAFGTSTGQFYCSYDKGESWQTVDAHLSPIYALELVDSLS